LDENDCRQAVFSLIRRVFACTDPLTGPANRWIEVQSTEYGLAPSNVCVLLASAAYGVMLPSGVLSDTDPGGLKSQTAAAGKALVLTGKGIAEELVPALARLNAGVDELAVGSGKAREGVAKKIMPAVDLLIGGISDAVMGSEKLSVGALAASSGSRDLASGIVKAGAGAERLSDGAGELSNGAKKLASGLGDAANGSGKLSDGLGKATEKGKAVPEGATRLSAEGTTQMGEKGKATASDYGLKYAVIVAGAERAKTEAMAYGAPANASGTTAYSLEISGANGDVGTSLNRGVGALALFGAGGGLVLLRRRRA
jgi:putative membrane protein